MMQRLGRGRILVRRGDGFVGHEVLEQPLQPGVFEGPDELAQRAPQLIDVLRGLGEIVGVIDFGVSQFAHLVEGELPAAVVLLHHAFDLDEVVLLKRVHRVGHVVPHVGLQLAGAVGQRDRQVGVAVLLGLDLLGGDHEVRGDGLVLVLLAVADVEVFHRETSMPNRDALTMVEPLMVPQYRTGWAGSRSTSVARARP